MSKRAHKRALKGRDQRRADFDRLPVETKKTMRRPGSLNPKRTPVTKARKR